MEKEVRGLLLEIVALVFIIIITIIVWPNLKEEHLKKTEVVMNYVNNLSIKTVNKEDYYLFPMTDEYAIDNLRRNTIEIKNNDNVNKEYILFLKIDKDCIDNINSLKFMFNNNIIDFNDVYSYEDGNYVYYQVYNNDVKDNDYVDYIYWIKSDNENMNINFKYSFEIV